MRIYRNASLYAFILLPMLIAAADTAISVRSEGVTGNSAVLDASSSLTNQVLAVVFLLNGILIAVSSRVSLGRIVAVVLPAALMVSWMLLSIEWSDFSDLTLRRAARATIEIATIALVAASIREPRELLRLFFWSFLIILSLDVASVAVPSHSFTSIGFAGVHENKNQLGEFLFCALPVFAIGSVDRAVSPFRIVAIFALACGIALLIISLSKSAIGVVVISGLLVVATRLMLSTNMYGRILLPMIAVLVCVVVGSIVLNVGLSEVLTWLFGDATLTGRDQMWRYALLKYDGHPMEGVGYGGLWQIGQQVEGALQYEHVRWIANQAHNGYIDIAAQLGNVGLLCLLIFLVLTFARILRYVAHIERTLLFGLGSYALYIFWGVAIYNVTESSLFRAGHAVWVKFLIVTMCAAALELRRKGKSVLTQRLATPSTARGSPRPQTSIGM